MKLYPFLFFLFCLNHGISQSSYDSIQNKEIIKLETQINQLVDSLSIYKEQVAQYKTINQAAGLAKEFVTNPISFLFKYGAILIAAILGLLSIFFWALKKLNPKWFTTIIQGWVEKYEEVNRLKEENQILVISSEQFSNERFIRKLFDKKRFPKKNITYVKGIDAAKSELKSGRFQVVLANNEDGELDQLKLEEILNDNKYMVMLSFGKSQHWNFQKYNGKIPEYINRLNLANSKAQVYNNLINALNYQDTLI